MLIANKTMRIYSSASIAANPVVVGSLIRHHLYNLSSQCVVKSLNYIYHSLIVQLLLSWNSKFVRRCNDSELVHPSRFPFLSNCQRLRTNNAMKFLCQKFCNNYFPVVNCLFELSVCQ